MIPSRAKGTTTCQVDSHFVAPSASAASRCSRGTASSASREMEMMNGNVMMARDHARGEIADPVGRSLEQRQKAECVLEERLHVLAHERNQREDRQQAENHTGYGGQQFDQKRASVGKLRRRQFGKEDGRAHSQRNRNQQAR